MNNNAFSYWKKKTTTPWLPLQKPERGKAIQKAAARENDDEDDEDG